MKRMLFYTLLAVQLLVIAFLVFQFEQIDKKGQTITLQTTETYDYTEFQSYNNTMQVEYEINRINSDLWDDREPLEWGNQVYALLKSDADNLYHVEQASTQELTTTSDDEIVLIGKYVFEDEWEKFQYVEFGIEDIRELDTFGSFTNEKPLLITSKIGKWGQYKVISIDQAEEQ